MSDELLCPQCGNGHIETGKQGFGLKKAAVGVAVGGIAGVAAGAINKNKVENLCGSCGHRWNPSSRPSRQQQIGTPETTLGYSNSEWYVSIVLFLIFCVGLFIYVVFFK